MMAALKASPQERWMAGSMSWNNDSCGMHINVSDRLADSGTWLKLMHFLLNSPPEVLEQIGGRPPCYYCHTHSNYSVPRKPKWYTVHTTLGNTTTYYKLLEEWRANQAAQTEFPFRKQHLQKHAAVSRRSWGGYEFRLFRSSSNPLRILGNCEMIAVMLAHFANTPWHEVCGDDGWPRVSLTDISRTAYKLRHRYPYAAALCRRVGNLLSRAFDS